MPFELVVERLNPVRSGGRHPLFQVALVLQNNEEARFGLPGLEVRSESLGTGTAKFDLTVNLWETFDADGAPAGIDGFIEYATDLYDRETVELLGGRLVRLLGGVVGDLGVRVGVVDVLGGVERERLLGWSGGGVGVPVSVPVPVSVSLPGLFGGRVRECPDAVAVVSGDVSWTYGEVAGRANRLARWLTGRGVGPGDVVAVAVPAGLEQLVTVLGVLGSGAGFVPVDVEYPGARIGWLLEDARPGLVLSTQAAAESLPEGLLAEVVAVDDPAMVEACASLPDDEVTDADRRRALELSDVAYVIYTSGSTGVPKGVEVT
ncbi:AMP-binding protein, partial [Streptomyces sp. NPDC006320]|uniref:AMP-binding protein n=1 Tax=Streptomyces sp. NPDC006320 TaxID=3156750 RepID=UPI0033A251FF